MKEVFAAIDRNETVTITHRGKPKAIMAPVRRAKPTLEEARRHPAFGMWKDRKDMKDPSAWVRNLRRSRIRDL
jgi:antitoxin (DNA-binding transcriptional repressor) of toxin-antitoxin stability system